MTDLGLLDPVSGFCADPAVWVQRAAELAVPDGLFIDGAFRSTQASMPCTTPRDGSLLASVAVAGPQEVDTAVTAARRAFDAGPWPRLRPRERAAHLLRWADLVERDRDLLALLVSLEMGKPIREAWTIELRALITTLRWYAEMADKEAGEVPAVGPDDVALVTREPSGVVAAVVPWNFPLTLAGWKIAPALAAGCTVILKPADQSPLSALHLAALAAEAGLPPGVFGVVTGPGVVTGRALGLHPGVDVLAFTGSTQVGREFLRYSADSNLKRVWLELGGKSPNIVLPDAPDLGVAADAAAWGVFFNSGQMCTAASRLLVHVDVAEEFTAAVVERAGRWIPGDPLDPKTRIGPLVDEVQLTRVLDHVRRGQAQGARLRTGGQAASSALPGPYLEPTIFDQVDPDADLARQEIFGPVLSVLTFTDVDDAVRLARATEYGLAAAVWTSDLRTAHRICAAVPAGTVWVNCYEEGDLTVPFGGRQASGHGRDKSRHAMEKYTDLKTTWISLR